MVAIIPIHRGNINEQRQSLFCSVPQEVLLENILSRLTISEIGKLKLTCKSLSVLTDHPLLFKDLLMRDFQKTEVESNCKSTYQHLHKIYQNMLNGNYHLMELKELAGVSHLKIEEDWLVGTSIGTLHFWNLKLNQYTKSIKAHEKGISCLEVQDGKIYTGSFDHTCKIWDLETGKCLAILEEHTETILHMKIIEKKLITSALDQTCKIWDLETHRCLYTFRGSGSIACFDAAKDILVVFFYKAGTTMMYCCQAWNMHSGECLYRFEKKGAITSIKVFDNAFIATCNTSNYKCEMRDLKTGELKENFPSEFAGINCLEIINDLVIFGGQSQWKSWNRKTGEILDSENSFAHFIGVVRVAQNKVFTASYWNNVIKIWDLKTGKYLRTFEITDLKQAAKGIHYLEITEGKFIISDTVSCWIGDFTKTQ